MFWQMVLTGSEQTDFQNLKHNTLKTNPFWSIKLISRTKLVT
jgi:hypothetical protein